jgi:Mycothiol maleylpyruvate isomerase N-terminal domain
VGTETAGRGGEGIAVDHAGHFSREVAAFEAAGRTAAGFEAAPAVPSCPGWVVTDLVLHLGVVHRAVARIIGQRMQQPPEGGDGRWLGLAEEWRGWLPPGHAPQRSPVPAGLLDWFHDGSAADFHVCYLDAGTRLALPAARPQQGRDRGASSYYETVKDSGEWPVCQCVECGAEAFVATTDTAETDPDVANWVCYACGHTCADTDIGQCVDCGIMTYKARDGLTVCGNCVAHALAD